MSTKGKPKNGDLFVYGDFSGLLLYTANTWHQINSRKVLAISVTPVGNIIYIGNTDKILRKLKDET